MAKTQFKSVDDYIAAQDEDVQNALKRVRAVIRKALPAAQEVISYNMPTYKLDDARVLQFAGWAGYFSLYGATSRVMAAFKGDLARYEVNKGTIRFPLSEPVPEQLIERIAKFRAGEVAGHQS